MYDSFSLEYDRFVNWPARLCVELPFIEGLLSRLEVQPGMPTRILDAACGTGVHAIALGQKGLMVAGADNSAGMIKQALFNASAAGVHIRFEKAGFGKLGQTFGAGAFDALLCLGNSLPHLLTPNDLRVAIQDFAICLRPGGLLLIQNRNFDGVLAHKERWMEPQTYRAGEAEWLFLRFYDFDPDNLITFNMVTLKRKSHGNWTQQATVTRLRPLLRDDMEAALTFAGFDYLTFYGNMNGEAYTPQVSGNLVVTARLPNP